MYDCVQQRPCMQRMSVIATFQKCPRCVSVRTRLVGRIGSGVRVSACFHMLSCAVVHAVARSGFRDTPDICVSAVSVKIPAGGSVTVRSTGYCQFSHIRVVNFSHNACIYIYVKYSITKTATRSAI